MGCENNLYNLISTIDKVFMSDSETGQLITSFTPVEFTLTTTDTTYPTIDCSYPLYGYGSNYEGCIKFEFDNKKKEDNMIKIKNVDVEYEKRTFVDENKRDENGNYTVTKKEIPVATIVTFENGSIQTAYCDENDEFNLEVGISICVTRELMKRLYGISGETNDYNKLIRQGMKVYKKHCKLQDTLEKKKAEAEAIEKNRKIKEQKRREKRAAKKKEREIEILAEAIKRANADSK